MSAIASVLEGKRFCSEALMVRLLHRADWGSEAADDSPISALSDRELEVFRLFGEGLTTHQIAERLHLSRNTIGTYRERLKAKLKMSGSIELSHFATRWMAEKS